MHSKKVRNSIIVLLLIIVGIFVGFNFYNSSKDLDTKNNIQGDKALVTNKSVSSSEISSNDETNNTNEAINDEVVANEPIDKEVELREKLSRYDGQSAVQINATLENPIEDNEQYIIIKTQFSTHSVNLDDYNFSKIVSFKSSEGIELSKEILWEKIEGGGHHYLGVYKIPKNINGRPFITENTEFIELNILNLDNVANRSFKWEKDILKLME